MPESALAEIIHNGQIQSCGSNSKLVHTAHTHVHTHSLEKNENAALSSLSVSSSNNLNKSMLHEKL
eukprot:1159394-Pelagomonas_calceolata.AAC.6